MYEGAWETAGAATVSYKSRHTHTNTTHANACLRTVAAALHVPALGPSSTVAEGFSDPPEGADVSWVRRKAWGREGTATIGAQATAHNSTTLTHHDTVASASAVVFLHVLAPFVGNLGAQGSFEVFYVLVVGFPLP